GTTGDIDGAGGGGGAGLGGAIYNQGTLTIERVTFIDNQAKGGEGGTGSTTTTTPGFGGGGGSLSGPGQPGTSTKGGEGALNAGSGAGPFGTGTNGSMGGGGGGAGSITSAKGGNGGFGGGGGAYGGRGGYGAGNGAPLNSATGGGGGGGAGMGGAIFNESGNITISNSTFIDNLAFGGLAGPGGGKGFGIGGAIANLNGNVTISSSTFSANSNNAAEQAGSLVNIAINGLTANVVSRNSIFETSISTPEFASFQASGSTATFSGNNNIVFNGSLSSPLGIISNSSALLGTTVIAPTGALVVPLTPGSPAIGAATPTGLFPFDQRQIKRQMAPSIGAYEYYAPPTSINISASSFAGQLENGQMIGTISAIGPFAGTAFSFSLVAGIGDTDNAEFYIRNNELFTTGQLAVGNYSICVRATGAAGDSYDQAISLVAKSDIVVNTPNDIVDPLDGKTSLREAIAEANLNPDHDRITFDNALRGIPVVLESVGSTAEGSSALVVSTAVSIQGLTSSTDFRIDPSSEMRFFRVETTGNLRLENIDLSGGLARGNKSGDINGKGGAILAHGPVSLIRSSILGARVYGAGGANPGNAMGGAIYTNANLDLLESTLADNKLFRGNDSTVAGQYTPSSSGNYYGAGIYAEATLKPISLNFQSVTIARNQGDNQANFAGGAIAIAPGLTPASGTIFFNANALVVQSDGNPADIDILPGLGSVDFNASNSFAGTLGSGVPTNGFTIGDPLLDYSTTGSRQSPVFRPQAGSPLIHAISNRTGQTDQTNLIRFSISAAGAAEYYAPPQGIIESDTQLGERLPEGLEAGIVRVQTSRESGSDFTFELVSGTGDTNNNAFRLEYIAGKSRDSAQIYSKQSFLASDGDRSIRVRVTGPTGLSIEQIVSITISPSIVVDTPDDITDNLDGKISLREALAQATNQPGIDRISFAPSLAGQTVYVGPDPTSMASTSAFVVDSSVLISGRDAPGLMIQPSAGNNIRFFNVSPFENLGLDALTLQGGNAVDGEGGAIFSDGGNIYLDSVTVRNNKASQVMAAGGAIRINNGSLEIVNSTFFNNSVENATGSGNFTGEGGHILATTNLATSEHSYGNSSPKFSIINSTFSNGSATGTSDGVAFITSSTTPTKVEVTGSVFANSTGNDISFIQIDNSLFSVNFNNNFVTTSGGLLAGLNFFTGDPMLGTLADNGGPTPTMEPLSGSPLIALNGIPPSNQPDQRGIIRGSKPTLGAFQVVQATNLSFTPTSGSLGIGSKAVFKIDFSHPVTYYGQPAIDLNVSGTQALAPTQPNGSIQSSFITLQYTVREGDSTNNLTASYANGGTFDVRDGVNHAVLIPQYNLVTGLNVDGIRPVSTLALTPNPGTTSNALTFSGIISFSEPVSGALLANDFKLTNANVSGISGPDAAGNYSFTLTPVADGKVSVAVIAPGITDGAGNSSVPSNNITFFSDKSPPAAQISLNTTAGGLTNINNLNGKVAFGEPVTGNLSVNDFTVVNATVSNISGPDANGIYTFNLNPTANGLVAVSLNAPSITDLAGNSATPASPFDFTFDNSSATPTIFLNPVPNNASNCQQRLVILWLRCLRRNGYRDFAL
ncbi:MAG: Ig-like domain-containing protein, partial [Planctomycetota bacterium]|nr:Ig-like domain-containing protein [Planctomycetota bacterium]